MIKFISPIKSESIIVIYKSYYQALERYNVNGTKLIFTDDYETWWGPGWEFDRGLNYTKVIEIGPLDNIIDIRS